MTNIGSYGVLGGASLMGWMDGIDNAAMLALRLIDLTWASAVEVRHRCFLWVFRDE